MKRLFSILLIAALSFQTLNANEPSQELELFEELQLVGDTESIAIAVLKSAADFGAFYWSFFPNAEELLTDTIWFSLLGTRLKGTIENLVGTDQSAKMIVRDVSKLPTTFIKWWWHIERGSTGRYYTEAKTWGQGAKVFSKAGCILACGQFTAYEPSWCGNQCNYVGDSLGRSLELGGREQKKAGSNTTFIPYAAENASSSWVTSAATDMIPKVFIMYHLGQLVKNKIAPAHFAKMLSKRLNGIAIMMIPAAVATTFVMGKVEFGADFAAEFAKNVGMTYLMVPVAGVVVEGGKLAMAKIGKKYEIEIADMKSWAQETFELYGEDIALVFIGLVL